MKRIICLIAMMACLFNATAHVAMASQGTCPVSLPDFKVTLNGIEINNSNSQYPLLVSNGITYVPMTYFDAKLLGLEPNWSQDKGFAIEKATFIPQGDMARSQYQHQVSEQPNLAQYQASLAVFPVTVAGKNIDNSLEPYPLLVFREITYFPLTWRFAVDEFGWQYHFDQASGLTITPVPTPVASQTLPSTVVVTGSVVNIRSDAGTDYTALAKVQKGDQLSVVGKQDDWYQVQLANGVKGWVANWLVADPLSVATVPEEERDTRPPNQMKLISFTPGQDLSKLTLLAGEQRKVKAVVSSADQLVLDISNNVLDNFGSSWTVVENAVGAIKSVQAATTNSGSVRLTINISPGAYCTVEAIGQELIVTTHSRNGQGAQGLAGKIIVIDPGHGGNDPGAVGAILGVTDRDVGWAISEHLRAMLQAKGAVVLMTRSDNSINLSPNERAPIANAVNADAFISVHANSIASNSMPFGARVFYYAPDTTPTLSAQKYVRLELAQCVNEGILAQTARKCQVQSQNYAVLRENNCPSILVEAGFLSNAEDEALLATDAYRLTIAQGICDGLERYFNRY